LEISLKKNRNLFTLIHDPQISNQIDAGDFKSLLKVNLIRWGLCEVVESNLPVRNLSVICFNWICRSLMSM